jgi:hypothetical protein
MSTIARIFNFAPGTPIFSSQVNQEFNQLVALLNGNSSDKEAFIVSSGSNPTLILSQIGVGPIQSWRQGVLDRAEIANTGRMRTKAGYGSVSPDEFITLGGLLASSTAQVGNSGSADTLLYSKTIKAYTFGADGDFIEITASGFFANNGNNKQFRVLFAGNLLFTTNAQVVQNQQYSLRATIVRINATSIRYTLSFTSTDASGVASFRKETTSFLNTVDLTIDNALELKSQSTATNDTNLWLVTIKKFSV